jgi:subtilisin
MVSRRVAIWLAAIGIAAWSWPAAAVAGPADERYIVVLEDGASASPAAAAEHAADVGGAVRGVYSTALEGYAAQLSSSEAQVIRQDPDVDLVVPDRTFSQPEPGFTYLDCDADPGAGQCLPYGVNRIDADQSSTLAGDGSGSIDGVNVALIDSGITADHPDLNVAGGLGCQSGSASTDPGSFVDSVGHGTAVAGVVGAEDNAFGVVGVAPGVPLWAVRVDNALGEIRESALLCAIDWVTSTRTDADAGNDVMVANMSLGFSIDPGPDAPCGSPDEDPVHIAICRSVAAGVLYTVAAGNSASGFEEIAPARYSEVLTVTAMADLDGVPGGLAPALCHGEDLGFPDGQDDAAAPFSNFARSGADQLHTVAAPGVCIDTTLPPEAGFPGYGAVDGTSLASPHIAGLAALCLSSGRCSGEPLLDIQRLVSDAEAANGSDSGHGFLGDPLRPLDFSYYGWLPSAALD